jgi:hypothetical protein
MCSKCQGVLRDGHGPLYSLVLDVLKDMDSDSRQATDPSLARVYDLFRRALILGVQGFIDAQADIVLEIWVKKHPDLWKAEVEDWFVREGLSRVPEIVDRFLRLGSIVPNKTPNPEVEVYLREGTRCFLYGFFQASTALARAAIEAGVKDCLAKRFGSVPECGLAQKIRVATKFSLLDPQRAKMARDVVKAAGRALHQETVKSCSLAFDAIACARGALEGLYGRQQVFHPWSLRLQLSATWPRS